MEKLEYVGIVDPNIFALIPKYLFDQIKDIGNTEKFRQYVAARLTVIVPTQSGELVRVPNPMVRMAVLHDNEHKIRGFLWAEIDEIEDYIFIQTLSVDPEYQTANGELQKQAVQYLFSTPGSKDRIRTATTKPKVFIERFGWTASSKSLVEISRNDLESENKQ